MQRHPQILNRRRSALLIVDVQERINAAVLHRQQVVDNTVRMVRACQILGIPIFVTEQYPQGLGPTESPVRETLGEIVPYTKLTFSCCGVKELMEQLHQHRVHQVIMVGIETHVCVLQTALDLLAGGFQVHVLRDAVSSRNEVDYQTALERMQTAGVVMSTVETALFELLEQARTPEFKEVAKLIK